MKVTTRPNKVKKETVGIVKVKVTKVRVTADLSGKVRRRE